MVLMLSKYEPAVRQAAAVAPELETSLLRDAKGPDEVERFLADASAFGARGISAHWSQVGPDLAERCAGRGLALYAWCKREVIEPDRAALLDGVVTDWPRAARTVIADL